MRTVSDDLIRALEDRPHLLYQLDPHRFEEVIADLLHLLGYKVTLTPASRDGGKDIYAAEKRPLGQFLYVVECKRYAPHRSVGINVVQRLYGVVQAERANAGVVVTTSRFSRNAKSFQGRVGYSLSLRDYLGVQAWLSQASQRLG